MTLYALTSHQSRVGGPSGFRPTLHRVFDEILKYEGRPRLDQAAAFCNLADFDGCKAKAFRKSRDGRPC